MKNTLCETSLISFYNRANSSQKFNCAWFKLIIHLCSISAFKSHGEPLMRNAGFCKSKNTLMASQNLQNSQKKTVILWQLARCCWFITLPAMEALAVWIQGGLKGGSWLSQYWIQPQKSMGPYGHRLHARSPTFPGSALDRVNIKSNSSFGMNS